MKVQRQDKILALAQPIMNTNSSHADRCMRDNTTFRHRADWDYSAHARQTRFVVCSVLGDNMSAVNARAALSHALY